MNYFIPVNEDRARADLTEVAKLAYERRYISGTEGNLSIRLDFERILTTPRGVCKGRLSPSDLVVTNLDGKALNASSEQGKKPSTELQMHLTVYRKRADIRAVVHAHPTHAVAFTVSGESLAQPILPESILALGALPVAPYATPSTEQVGAGIENLVETCDCLMLDHHGALTMAKSIHEAFYLLETLEHHAETLYKARMLGGARPLSKGQIGELADICHIYGMKFPASAKEWIE